MMLIDAMISFVVVGSQVDCVHITVRSVMILKSKVHSCLYSGVKHQSAVNRSSSFFHILQTEQIIIKQTLHEINQSAGSTVLEYISFEDC